MKTSLGHPGKTLPIDAFLTVETTYAVLRASRSGGMRPIGLRAMPMFADANPCDREDLRQFPCSSITASAQTDRRPGGWMNSAGGTGGGRSIWLRPLQLLDPGEAALETTGHF
jgi:hypothetical protein